ncbi:Uncharacterized protein BP5553_07574 [Venustampulla echinocandica]|uniref:Uncharacterized protein n=1 Tax=Venustampulla echinocandica TaxID=2656787 RepID=A0A370TGX6_9HELO|nr:Uncharacterized protein BP5553_07574 [Venustampulla echinocandica]RDL34446.1 Uncharacterized protein BP5553_07574 [Venustampulla echinocandica]
MLYSYALTALLSASSVIALPLNINLGAFSPALVVGDGEISFGGAEEAKSLVETLSGATATGQGAATGLTRAQEAGLGSPVAETGPAVVAPSVSAVPTILPGAGIGRDIQPREEEVDEDEESAAVEKRDLAGFNAALNFATGALKSGPEVQLGTGEGGSGVGIIVRPPGTAAPAKPGKRAVVQNERDLS